jgi:hypothetical protein
MISAWALARVSDQAAVDQQPVHDAIACRAFMSGDQPPRQWRQRSSSSVRRHGEPDRHAPPQAEPPKPHQKASVTPLPRPNTQ